MGYKRCCICKRLQEILSKDWRYVNYKWEYVCSLTCVEGWIKRPRSLDARVGGSYSKAGMHSLFRSDYELYVAAWLQSRGIEWEHERWLFRLGETGSYTPDFYLPVYRAFLEVKGKWVIGQKKKLSLFHRRFPYAPLLIVPWTLHGQFYERGGQYDQRTEYGSIGL